MSGITLARPLQLVDKPVTRVENFCATGAEALRQAAYAVASGAYDTAMAIGVEKTKDGGYQGLNAVPPPNDGTARTLDRRRDVLHGRSRVRRRSTASTPTRCARRWRTSRGRTTTTARATRVRSSGARCRSRRSATRRRWRATCGVFDCAGVADGSAAAIVVRAEDAYEYTDTPIFVKALSFIAGNGGGVTDPAYDYTYFPEIVATARDAYAQAGITDPRRELALAEVHDCFTITELVLMEDLGFSERGGAWRDELDGVYDLDGELPVNPDGGLKSFGHPVGASGLRMMFEAWLQLRGEAPPERQIEAAKPGGEPGLALTHNLGGYPGEMVSFISVLGR